jgi:hypothetical protein
LESEKWPVRPVDDWEGPDEDELAEWLNWMAVLHVPLAGERAIYEPIIEPSGKAVSFVQKV